MAKKKEAPKENNEFVVVESGSKQYILEVGSVISIEKIDHPKNNTFTFDTVLLHSKDGKASVGSPSLDIAVQADILQDEKDKKILFSIFIFISFFTYGLLIYFNFSN